MTIAELFVAIGLKVENLEQLTALETTLRNITKQARDAVAAIKALNQATISTPAPSPAPTAPGGPNPATTPSVVAPGNPPPIPPTPATPAPPPLPPAPPPSRVVSWTKAIKALSTEINKLAVGVAAVTTAVIVLINKSIDATMKMANFGTATGLSTDRLQQFQHAAQVGGASANEMLGLLDSLQLKQAQIALGEGDLSPFAFFGIDPNQDTNAVIDQLRVKLKTFSKEQLAVAREMAARLGIGRDLFASMLRESRKLDEAFVMSQESIKATQELNAAWQDMTFRLASIRNQIVSALAPAFAQLTRAIGVLLTPLAKWLKFINGTSVYAKAARAALVFLAIQLGIISAAIFFGATALTAFATSAGIATAATSTFGVALWTALAPVLPIIGAAVAFFGLLAATITALVLVVEDFWTAFTGGDSAVGRLVEKLGFVDALAKRFQLIADIWDFITGGITTASDLLKDFTALVPDWVKNIFGGGEGAAVNPMQNITQAAAMPPSNQPNKSGGVNNQTNDVTINVDGSKDPQATGKAVNDGLGRALADAAYQMPVASY